MCYKMQEVESDPDVMNEDSELGRNLFNIWTFLFTCVVGRLVVHT